SAAQLAVVVSLGRRRATPVAQCRCWLLHVAMQVLSVASCLRRLCSIFSLPPGGVGDVLFFFFQAEDGIRDWSVTGVQTCALPICPLIHDTGQLVGGEDLADGMVGDLCRE